MAAARHLVRVVPVALLTPLLLAGGCSRERVPLPPPTASPEEIVRAYVAAINADDCKTMTALSDEGHSVRAWCGGIDITDLTIGDPFPDTCCGTQPAAQVINVPVTFHLTGADSSMPDGDHAWGYILVRDDDTQRWRVAEEGVG